VAIELTTDSDQNTIDDTTISRHESAPAVHCAAGGQIALSGVASGDSTARRVRQNFQVEAISDEFQNTGDAPLITVVDSKLILESDEFTGVCSAGVVVTGAQSQVVLTAPVVTEPSGTGVSVSET
jgi:hypothetical protein